MHSSILVQLEEQTSSRMNLTAIYYPIESGMGVKCGEDGGKSDPRVSLGSSLIGVPLQ